MDENMAETGIIQGLQKVLEAVQEERKVIHECPFLQLPEHLKLFDGVHKSSLDVIGEGRQVVTKIQSASEEIKEELAEFKDEFEARIEEEKSHYIFCDDPSEWDKDATEAFKAAAEALKVLNELEGLAAGLEDEAGETDIYMSGIQSDIKDIKITTRKVKNLRKELTDKWKKEKAAEAKRKKQREKEKREEAERLRREEEELRRAEEERLRLEEEERERLEKERLQKEEEDRLRAEAERLRIEEEERQKREAEERKKEKERKLRERREREEKERQVRLEKERKAKEEAELERTERERKNPNNWPVWIKYLKRGQLDEQIGCIIRAMPGQVQEDDFSVAEADKSSGKILLDDFEEVASKLLNIKYTSDEEKFPKLEAPLNIALPTVLSQVSHGKELVVKTQRPSENWDELESDICKFDEVKKQKFLSAPLDRFRRNTTLAIVSRNKLDEKSINKNGGDVISSVDKGIRYTIPEGAIDLRITATIQVQLIDHNTIQEVKEKRSDVCTKLTGCSAIVDMGLPQHLNKPIHVEAPVCGVQKRASRPQTSRIAATQPAAPQIERSKTTHGGMNQEVFQGKDREVVRCVAKNRKGWSIMPEINCRCTNSELVSFKLEKPVKRFVLIRAVENTTSEEFVHMAQVLENAVNLKPVKVLLKQYKKDPTQIAVQCVPSNKVARYEEQLADDGFSEGPSPSKELRLMENQLLPISFRGNIQATYEGDLVFVYNNSTNKRLVFEVKAVDEFLSNHHGMVIVSSRSFERREIVEEGTESGDTTTKSILEEKDERICELQVQIPKRTQTKQARPKSARKANVTYRSNGCVDEALLHELAEMIDEDWSVLAGHLKFTPVAIQRLKKDYGKDGNTVLAFRMFMDWIKKCPREYDKLKGLKKALYYSDRDDLLDILNARNAEFQRQKTMDV